MAKLTRQIEPRSSANQPPGFIIPEALYTLEEIKARLRMKHRSWRHLRDVGARAIKFGRFKYILGSSVIEMITQSPQEDETDDIQPSSPLRFKGDDSRKKTMVKHIQNPTVIQAAGQPSKSIEEFIGWLNSGTKEVSIARMKSPTGWSEPGQTPEFDEYTVVLQGCLHVKMKEQEFDISANQAIIIKAGEWVQYSTPSPEGAEYIAVCIPAFSPEKVHRAER